ncbi:cytochrome b [Pseudothauera rhizosphaerae]|nr:cytochrome b/b6 domain-containing protein [Pseudothauera rhizosphaerae]
MTGGAMLQSQHFNVTARLLHWLLYVLMLALALLGWATLSAAGYPVTMLKGFELPPIAPVGPVWYALLRDAHSLLAWLLFTTVLVHLAVALLSALFARAAWGASSSPEICRAVHVADIWTLGSVTRFWAVLLTVGIFCFVVLVMKGPAYIADRYDLPDSDRPD